jgi:hypothetical protein
LPACARYLKRCVSVGAGRQDLSTFRHGQQRGVKTHACLMFLVWQSRIVVHRKRLTLHDELVFAGALRLEAARAIQ